MKQVCVLGNGQLGRMLRQAGEPLGIAVWPVGLEADPAAVPFQQSVITAEIERWPETALTRELAEHTAIVNRDVFPTSSVWQPRRGNCWPTPMSGRAFLTVWANWRSSSAVPAATMAAASGVCAKTTPRSCRKSAMANASSSRALTSPAKCRWLAPALATVAPCSIR